ncbi:hypothetical protein AK830_g11473 [Neonectria ditissima]|uniref:DUF7924 domain-containing protein n=1 Tax=Neonectria ditissima TaxID=78410 RepID=A0A0P7B1A2_9HYPO|nr:hypothetical protein AK830_g11473 [Neonectria ditissima]
MARPQSRKRQRADELLQDSPLAKRAKSTGGRNFSPAFWDNLSKVWLTPRALRELDRRNNKRPSPVFTPPEVCSADLARFARRGGPDLRHLRGYPEPKGVAHEMDSGRPSPSQSRPTQSTQPTTVGGRSGKSSAYGKEFQQHLTDYGVHVNDRRSKLGNPAELQSELMQERPSLSPSRFSEGAFENFRRDDEDAVFESDVMAKVIPAICGSANIPNKQNVLFTELSPITNKDAVKPKPDFFDGAHLRDLSKEVREDQDLRPMIIPTKHASVPAAPNFFLEVKGPDGNTSVAQRQVCYDGAYGTRAMHALQNYGETEPAYDGNAYTYSSTYHDGQLKLYAHHPTAPTTAGGRPEYHMTRVKAFAMTSDRETFAQGAAAFRNARDFAQRHRDNFIQAANARASGEEIVAAQEGLDITTEIQHEEDSNDELALSSPHCTTEIQHAEDSADELALTPHYLYADEDSQDPSQASMAPDINDPSMSFTTSFTSSLSSCQTRSKRQRSPRSSEHRASKSRTCRNTRAAQSPAPPMGSAQAGAAESGWVETYWRKGKLCFKNPQDQEVKTEMNDWVGRLLDDGTHCLCWRSPKSRRVFWATELAIEPRKKRSSR